MNGLRIFALTGLALSVAALTTGCPLRQANVFRIWVVNASDEYRVVSVEITSSEDSDTREVLGNGTIRTNETGVFAAVSLDDFDNETISITIRGVVDNSKGVFDVESTVVIPDPVIGGLTIPIVVDGNTALTYEADYYPLNEESKLQMTLTDMSAK